MGSTSYDYTGDTVVITGASSGIGREIARQFGKAGAAVVNADVREDPKDDHLTKPTHELIEDSGGTAAFLETDVSVREDVEDAMSVAAEYGGVDIMINNAGSYITGPIRDLSVEDLEALHAVNVRGVFLGTQIAADRMINRGVSGLILNLASISSSLAQSGQLLYDMTKGAVRMATRGAALELAEHGLRVNAVAPGQIHKGPDEPSQETREALRKPIPSQRFGRPSDVASAVLFLASEQASYVNGELLHIDGGWQIA